MTANRVISKSLAGRQDILFGNGQVTQTRAGGSYPINKVSMVWACAAHAELLTLDTTQFTQATVSYQGAVTHWGWTGSHWHCQETGLTLLGSFEDGFTCTSANQVGCTATEIYSWGGSLPHVVAPGTDPAAISSGYVPRTDVVLRNELLAGALVQRNNSRFAMRDFVSVKDFYTTTWNQAFADACAYLESVGGGTLYAPAGLYQLTAPIVIPSAVTLLGAGRATVIENSTAVAFPAGNCIHVGKHSEWPAGNSIVDATLAELLGNNFSNITTWDARVENLTVKSAGAGLGLWFLNAGRCGWRNIWSENTLTPVNVANDNQAHQSACFDIDGDGIYQVNGTLSQWYDLLFVGSCVGLKVKRLFNNPLTKSVLPEMAVINGAVNWSVDAGNLIGNESGTTQGSTKGILVEGANVSNGRISGLNCSKMTDAVVLGATGGGVIVDGNTFDKCYSPVQLNSAGNTVSNNTFDNNVIDIAGNAAGVDNDIVSNTGIRNVVSAANSDPMLVNRFRGNKRKDESLVANTRAYGAATADKLTLFPLDALIDSAAESGVIRTAAVLVKSTTGLVSLWYKLPGNIRKVKKATVYGYGATGGINIIVNIAGLDSNNNTNSIPNYEATPAFESGAGDFGTTVAFNNPLYLAGSYFLKVEADFHDTSAQLRTIVLDVDLD